MKACPWQLVGENTGGNVYWCEDCGAIFSEGDPTEPPQSPMKLDRDTLYCVDQGLVP